MNFPVPQTPGRDSLPLKVVVVLIRSACRLFLVRELFILETIKKILNLTVHMCKLPACWTYPKSVTINGGQTCDSSSSKYSALWLSIVLHGIFLRSRDWLSIMWLCQDRVVVEKGKSDDSLPLTGRTKHQEKFALLSLSLWSGHRMLSRSFFCTNSSVPLEVLPQQYYCLRYATITSRCCFTLKNHGNML